ncbi:MAG: ComF family protein [Clostridia bacterium]|nr:ComF family protein [Clostridia bacterium]
MKILKSLKNIKTKVSDFIFPYDLTCVVCNEELTGMDMYSICLHCLRDVDFIYKSCEKCGSKVIADTRFCSDCKVHGKLVERNFSACLYDGNIKLLIHKFKYSGARYLKAPLGKILYDKYLDITKEGNTFDLIIPVPLSKSKLRERGFNQSSLLLESFDKDRRLVREDVLIRVKDTSIQAKLTREERLTNMQDAFSVINQDIVKGKRVLVVDDVYTTGVTIDECVKVLISAGAKSVMSLTVAHSHEDRAIDEFEKVAID